MERDNKRLTILNHNAFWFQGYPFPDDVPPEPAASIMQRLVSLYREVDPDILCLQEIQSLEAFESVSAQMAFTGYFCPGREFPQYGTGILTSFDGCRSHSNSQGQTSTVQRAWQTCEIDLGKNCLRICNAHLPSSRQLGPEKAATQRIAELDEMIRSCDAGPDIIVGDFNEFPGGAICAYMAAKGYIDTAVAMNAGERSTGLARYRGDYIWIKTSLLDGLKEYHVYDKDNFTFGMNGKQFLSDHLPLWIVLEV